MDDFVVGANLPWLRYGCDFGANAWQPGGGLGDGARASEAARSLVRARGAGASVIRWFVLCDGRAGCRFDADGTPAGLDDLVWRDLTCAMTLARDAGVRLLFSLLDFHWCLARRWVSGVALGGRTHVLRDAAAMHALVERVIVPLAAACGDDPAVYGWEIINEPEWVTWGYGGRHPRTVLRASLMRRFLSTAAAGIRRHSTRPITVGSAHVKGLDLVRGVGLDFYQVHWYDTLEPRFPLRTPVSSLAIDRPIWLGEFPTRGSQRSVEWLLDTTRAAGYQGALFWSLLAGDQASDGPYAERALINWTR